MILWPIFSPVSVIVGIFDAFSKRPTLLMSLTVGVGAILIVGFATRADCINRSVGQIANIDTIVGFGWLLQKSVSRDEVAKALGLVPN